MMMAKVQRRRRRHGGIKWFENIGEKKWGCGWTGTVEREGWERTSWGHARHYMHVRRYGNDGAGHNPFDLRAMTKPIPSLKGTSILTIYGQI